MGHRRKHLFGGEANHASARTFIDHGTELDEVLEGVIDEDELTQLLKEEKAMHNAGYNGGSGVPYTSSKSCSHDGYWPEIELMCGVELSGAKGHQLKDWTPQITLIIDCAGMVSLPTFPTVNKFVEGVDTLWPELKPEPLPEHCPPPPILRLNWPDQGAPPVEHAWWSRLLEFIKAKHMGHVIAACVGGHGRTGTCLASLMLVDDPKRSVRDVVEEVRAYHCENAVESTAQFKYLGKFRPKELERDAWLRYEAGLTNEKP